MLNVSSDFLSAIKQGSRTVDASVGIGDKTLTNIITSGNFPNGTTGWTIQTIAGVTTLNGVISGTATASGSKVTQSGLAITAGNKYYVASYVKATTPNVFALLYDGVNSYNLPNHSASGRFELLSSIIIPANTTASAGQFQPLRDNNVIGWQPISMKSPLLINLTQMFGAGNEPTQSFMDDLFKRVGWFNGTKKVPLTFLSTSTINNFFIDSALGNGNVPSIGSTISNKLTMITINDGLLPQAIVGQVIRPYVSIDVTGLGEYEWVKLGEFYANYDGIDISKLETTLECFDMMAVYMDIAYSAPVGLTMTVQGVLNSLATTYGVKFATQTGIPTSTVIKVIPTGSVRQVLSDMASLMSTNATLDGDGCVKFVFLNTVPQATFELGLDNYSDFKLQPDSMASITQLISTDGTNEIPVGNTSGYSLAFQNSQVTVLADVQTVYNRIFPVNYYAYTMKAQGMPHLELGDVITFTYLKLDGSQATINVPILKHKFTFKGAFVSEFSASAPAKQTTSVTVTSGSSLADVASSPLPSYIQNTKITSTTIEAPIIVGGLIQGARIQQLNGAVVLADMTTNVNGGLLEINDIGGLLNVRLGSETGSGSNIGGKLILYNDGLAYPRVELGISTTNGSPVGGGSGIVNMRDNSGTYRANLYADSPVGATLSLRNSAGTEVSYLRESSGMIGSSPIITSASLATALTNYAPLASPSFSGTLYASNIYASTGYSGLGRTYAIKWSGLLSTTTPVTITHNLGYYPIVSFGLSGSGAGANAILTFEHISTTQVKVGCYINNINAVAYLW